MASRTNRGFSLLEMAIVVTIIFILVALAVPSLLTRVYAIRVHYSATDLSGLLQRARMEAVRKNTFYSIQNVPGNPVMERVVDQGFNPVASIPPAQMSQTVNVFYGTGSGAPNEAAFIASLNFAVAPGAWGLPSFNARGLPCINTGWVTCQMFLGQGYVFFLSGTGAGNGARDWASVVVTPSGRVQVFTYTGTGGTWVQR